MGTDFQHYDPTIEDCYRKQWVVDGQPCLLEVLDTAGQGEHHIKNCPPRPLTIQRSIRRFAISGYGTLDIRTLLTFSDGEGFLIVYSITSRTSFERVQRIIDRVYRVKEELAHSSSPVDQYGRPYQPNHPYGQQSSGSRRFPIVLVGNKKDHYNGREVSTEEGKALAMSIGCEFFETSAKANSNVELCFKSLVRRIKSEREGGGMGGVGATGGQRRQKKKCTIL